MGALMVVLTVDQSADLMVGAMVEQLAGSLADVTAAMMVDQ
jgi:hypothetical protein